jgi:small redox-active disulfide protein 2
MNSKYDLEDDAMKIEVLGTGCARCKQLYQNTMQAVMDAKVDADVEKVEDIQQILKYGVMSTPALVVDGVVKFSGKVPSAEEVKRLIS